MIIDVHHHLGNEPDYADRLAEECARLGVKQVWLMGLPEPWAGSDNDRIQQAFEKYPELLVGFAWVSLGVDRPSKVNELKDRGFTGLKFINPTMPYDDGRLYPIYERAAELGMPGLFHLGVVVRHEGMEDKFINSDFMRPIHLDASARTFPDWTMIGAHFGNPWHKEAAMCCRWNPNLYFDLSGSTLKCTPFEYLGELLWWRRGSPYRDPLGRDAWEKILFASDVPYDQLHDLINDHKMLMDRLELKKSLRDKIWYKTAQSLLKPSKRKRKTVGVYPLSVPETSR